MRMKKKHNQLLKNFHALEERVNRLYSHMHNPPERKVDSALVFEGFESWAVYLTDNDRWDDKNKIGSGGSDDSFAFSYLPGTTYYLLLHFRGGRVYRNIEPKRTETHKVILDTERVTTVFNDEESE